jgi:putative transposase
MDLESIDFISNPYLQSLPQSHNKRKKNNSTSKPLKKQKSEKESSPKSSYPSSITNWFKHSVSEKLWIPYGDLKSHLDSKKLYKKNSQWDIRWKDALNPTKCKLNNVNIQREEPEEDSSKKSLKIRILPTSEQKEILKQWIGTSRLMYNRALALVRNGERINAYELRDKLIHSKGKEDEWLSTIPNSVRYGGVAQLVQAFKTIFAKKKKEPFDVHFMNKKKLRTGVINFDKRCCSFKPNKSSTTEAFASISKRNLGSSLKIKDSEKVIQKLLEWKHPPCDFKIQCCYRTGDWFLILPYELDEEIDEHKEYLKPKHSVIALDPGSRAFMSAYSPSAGFGTFPENGLEKTKQILEKIDNLNSFLSKTKNDKELRKQYGKNAIRNRVKLIHKLWEKTRNIRHHMHYTLCNFLLDNFQRILLPKFETQKMVNFQFFKFLM